MSNTTIKIFINRQKYEIRVSTQTGQFLKELAEIALGDVLFRQQPGDDEVIANEASVQLKNGDQLHSQPPADYGEQTARYQHVEEVPQRNGWLFKIYNDYELPVEFVPRKVRLLVKLAPTFPDAQPDMFWVSPPVLVGSTGASPRGTSMENVLDEQWQRFSWHLAPGAWRPGISELRDFLRCVMARFLRRN